MHFGSIRVDDGGRVPTPETGAMSIRQRTGDSAAGMPLAKPARLKQATGLAEYRSAPTGS